MMGQFAANPRDHMKFPLTIEAHDPRLAFRIAGKGNSVKTGAIVEVPGGAQIEYRGSYVRKAAFFPEILQFIVDASVTIDLALFAAWLYDNVKDSSIERITIERKEIVEISEDKIRVTLEEIVRSGDSDGNN